MPDKEKLNIHQKILKIADAAGVLRKSKEGFNYKYVPEEDIQAKVTACMQKYGVVLYPSIVPDTLTVTPYSYQKPKTKTVKDEKGKATTVEYTVPVNEIIVKAEVNYEWVNAEDPTDTRVCRWAYIGQMEDASQAFGAGATYGNRYFLMKALQLATSEADPDKYRSKQKEAENYEDDKKQKAADEALAKEKKEIIELGSALIAAGATKKSVTETVAKFNNGNGNPNSIANEDVCAKVKAAFEEMKNAQTKDNKPAKAEKEIKK